MKIRYAGRTQGASHPFISRVTIRIERRPMYGARLMPANAITTAEDSADGKSLRWGQGRRLEFIDFRLLWEGRINRGELVDFFGISTPQASLDLARYMELAPGNLAYDRSEKVYRATADFKAVLVPGDSQAYLNPLLAIHSGVLPASQ